MGEVTFERISQAESWDVFDAAARRLLHISGEAFAQRWDDGGYKDADDSAVMKVAMLRPSGR